MASRCRSCPVSLLCLAGQLTIYLYCEICRCLEVEYTSAPAEITVRKVPCDFFDARHLGTVLSVCHECQRERRERLRGRVRAIRATR